MSEVEKQESQKTVVAFISGLLIGGLLVWVFSSSPESAVAPESTDETKTEETTEVSKTTETTTETKATDVVTGEGSVIVSDQAAGAVVVIDSISLPTANGWVVVREFTNGVSGNVLGAARYSVEEGLTPSTIELLRSTVSGQTYQVVFFTNYGDKGFGLGEDVIIDGIATTFDAI